MAGGGGLGEEREGTVEGGMHVAVEAVGELVEGLSLDADEVSGTGWSDGGHSLGTQALAEDHASRRGKAIDWRERTTWIQG